MDAFNNARKKQYPEGVDQEKYYTENDIENNAMEKGVRWSYHPLYEDPWVHTLAMEVEDREHYNDWIAHQDVHNWKEGPDFKYHYEWYKNNRTVQRAWYVAIDSMKPKDAEQNLKQQYDKGVRVLYRCKINITMNWANLFQKETRFATFTVVTTPPINIE